MRQLKEKNMPALWDLVKRTSKIKFAHSELPCLTTAGHSGATKCCGLSYP